MTSVKISKHGKRGVNLGAQDHSEWRGQQTDTAGRTFSTESLLSSPPDGKAVVGKSVSSIEHFRETLMDHRAR
jgi:hypothetical protein